MSKTSAPRQSNANNDRQVSEPSSPETSNHSTEIPNDRDSCETSESEQEKKGITRKEKFNSQNFCNNQDSKNRSLDGRKSINDSNCIDPKEGPSWLYDSDSQLESPLPVDTRQTIKQSELEKLNRRHSISPLSSLSNERRQSFNCFRVPELPKYCRKISTTRIDLNRDYQPNNSKVEFSNNGSNSKR